MLQDPFLEVFQLAVDPFWCGLSFDHFAVLVCHTHQALRLDKVATLLYPWKKIDLNLCEALSCVLLSYQPHLNKTKIFHAISVKVAILNISR